eukprot:9192203-Alexandrium_andersonii.AAC.1
MVATPKLCAWSGLTTAKDPRVREHQLGATRGRGVPRMTLASGRGSTTWAPAKHGRQCATTCSGIKAEKTPASAIRHSMRQQPEGATNSPA